MQKRLTIIATSVAASMAILIACNQQPAAAGNSVDTSKTATAAMPAFNGFESQEKWGEHLVIVTGCNDCHTPKKMGPNGPEPDMSLMLSGHPAQVPPPPIDQKEAAKKGIAVTQDLTAWVGAWGITYAVNLTPDSTGLGAWTEEQFSKAIREGKWMGLENTRPVMPPMPWQDFKNFTDDEVKAIFAYLKSIPAIHNIVAQAVLAPPPPVK